jgi:imidazoleglycerol phosphate dehydratase HisB
MTTDSTKDTPDAPLTSRIGEANRVTRETKIACKVDLDGSGRAAISSGLPFLDHMLNSFTLHGSFDIELTCAGDLEIDDHHTVEDCALALGAAIYSALGERRGIERYGAAYVPMDESLARVVIDLSGRAASVTLLGMKRESIGGIATENFDHFFTSIASTLRASIHVDVLRGANDHHRIEAAFKAFGRALRDACRPTRSAAIPSLKGTLA